MSLEGFEVAAKITGAGAKNIAILLYSILKEEKKTKGKARLTSMLRSGKELKVLDRFLFFTAYPAGFGVKLLSLLKQGRHLRFQRAFI